MSSENSQTFCFMRGKDCVFVTNLGGSGPKWTGAILKTTEKATGDELTQTISFEVNKAEGQVITLKERVRKNADQEISFTFEYSADKDVPLTQLAVRMPFEKRFQDGDVLLKHADGTESKLPLSIGGPGARRATETIIFRSKTAGDVTVTIRPPLPLAYHGVLKAVLAADLFKAGKQSVTITFHTPAAVNLLVKEADIDRFVRSKAVPEEDRVFRADDAHPFEPARDASKSLIDLRTLNEKEAGQSGYLKLSPSGDEFLLGDGTPVRLWAVNANINAFDDKQLDQNGRWLARMGVNMVRLSGATFQSKASGSKVTDIAEDSRKQAWRIVAALKKQGIYTTIHPYWGAGSGADLTHWGIDGYTGKDHPWGLLFFNKELQRGYRAWLKEIFSPTNPYTGIPLAKDPAFGVFILQNEDSLLWWSSQGIKPQQKAVLASCFADWLKAKYGSLEAAAKAWGGDTLKDDRLADGVVGLYEVFAMTTPQPAGKAKRIDDQYRFLVETMRRFNAETAAYLHDELGCKALVCPGNWRTANDETMIDAERWSYMAGDVVAKNHYFNAIHVGGAAGWAVTPGQFFADQSVLLSPWMLPINMKQVAGRPNVITESTWTNPNLYQSEAAFLVAAYGSLTGLSGFYWFAVNGPEYVQPPMQKFPVCQPMIGGMFPATSLVYRKDFVQQARPVVHEERSQAELWERKRPVITEGQAFDPNRDAVDRSGKVAAATQADPLAFLVGRVEVRPDGDAAKTTIADLSNCLDAKNKIIRSRTGELVWNYQVGVCTINAPKAQGACGFLKRAGTIDLADVQIASADSYASVLVVPLDDLPVKQSKRLLVQVGTTARPTGWKTEPAIMRPAGADADCERIVERGKAPWLIGNAHLTVRIANAALNKAMLLDGGGCPLREVALQRDGTAAVVKAPPETMYLVLSGN